MIKSAHWLYNNLDHAHLVILDASLENVKPRTTQIPGTRFFDIKGKFSDKVSQFPNTMPDPLQFQKEAQLLGINEESTLVIYDNEGIYSAPRALYMFKSMGHQEVYVLDGGLPEWQKQGYPTTELTSNEEKKGNFTAKYNPEYFFSIDQVKENISAKKALLVDARSSGRFNGLAPEPRAELKSGCITGSVNLPYTEVLSDGKFKSPSELRSLFKDDQPLVFTCGSGITACIIWLAAEIAEIETEKSVFDGSWTEWALTEGLVVKS